MTIRWPDSQLRVHTPSELISPQPAQPGAGFSDYFKDALAQVAGTDYGDKTTNVGLMTGTLDDLHSATMAAQKAEITLNLVVQMRTKMVESYQEIMRMQI